MVTSSLSFAANEKPQLTLGDKISVFSDKAYRKNNGRYFEAVGNVVIISQQDTVYGEHASLNQDTMMVNIEGNVRLITKDMTLYGSHLDYNVTTGVAHIKNARILTPDFNVVANELTRVSESQYIAHESEFTTCKDCAESWAVYGKFIKIEVGKYIEIKNGLFKVKGIDVLYLPYLYLPILAKRETGLLIPFFGSRPVEGFIFEQPFFWAIDESKDMTISPTFWAKRGVGGDVQYRHRFKDLSWFEGNVRGINDAIYTPGEANVGTSGSQYFRYFTELETHQQFTPNFNLHMRYAASRDLDFVRDFPQYTDQRINSSDFGFSGFMQIRQEQFSVGGSSDYLRNQLFTDPVQFDRSYVQTVPRVTLNTIPYSIVQSKIPMFQHIAVGADGSFARFRQVNPDETVNIRNADRVSLQPYIMWHLLTWGPVGLKSKYTFDQQSYQFSEGTQPNAGKNAGILKTEVSFTMDKIFGLAYEEKIPLKYVSEADLARLRESKEQGLTPLKTEEKTNRLVGELPEYESALAKDNIVQIRNSFRHSQEFKFIHHYIASENEYGNKRFIDQIRTSQAGFFDYEDSIRSKENLFGTSTTRTIMPPENTLEFQWNNTLIKKSPKSFSFLEDDKYLRDNFAYQKIGWFNISQGYLLNQRDDDLRQRLTRFFMDTGYSGNRWFVGMQEYYFHYENKNIFNINFTKRFEFINLLSNYNYNSFGTTTLNTLQFGGQIRPTDIIGFSMVKDIDFEAKKDLRTLYSLDIMPHNNCYIFSLGYRKSYIEQYTFNIMFNFGDDKFDRYRNDYFGAKRLR